MNGCESRCVETDDDGVYSARVLSKLLSAEVNSDVGLPRVLKYVPDGNQDKVFKTNTGGTNVPLGRIGSLVLCFLNRRKASVLQIVELI